MTEPLFIGVAEVARLLEFRSVSSFRQRRRALDALGFPPPVPIFGAPQRWRRAHVIEWRDTVGTAAALLPPPPQTQASRAAAGLRLMKEAATR